MNPSHNLRDRKPDLSPFLFHFTSGYNSIDNILSIITDKKMICKMDCDKDLKAVCFTESPITLSSDVFCYMNSWPKPIFSKYGIAFKRDVLIRDYNARPVIYGDTKEQEILPNEVQWRFLLLDVNRYDYQWLREWRIKGEVFDFSKLSINDYFIIAPTNDDLKRIISYQELDDIDFDYDHGVCYAYAIYKSTRELKGISFEELSHYSNDRELEIATDKQEIGEEIK